jgi:hypothetical protein
MSIFPTTNGATGGESFLVGIESADLFSLEVSIIFAHSFLLIIEFTGVGLGGLYSG